MKLNTHISINKDNKDLTLYVDNEKYKNIPNGMRETNPHYMHEYLVDLVGRRP